MSRVATGCLNIGLRPSFSQRPAASAAVGTLFFMLMICICPVFASVLSPDGPVTSRRTVQASTTAGPYFETRRHRVGQIRLSLDNTGLYGAQYDGCIQQSSLGLEYPAGSDVTFFYGGGLWIGAVKDGDTLVSVGFDSWSDVHEMFPGAYPQGAMVERTTRAVLKAEKGAFCTDTEFDVQARSEQDLIAVYYDTLTSSQYVTFDPIDSRPHVPLGLEITQTSYAWSFGYAQDFIIIEYTIRNVGHGRPPRDTQTLQNVYVALYGHEGVHHSTNSIGWDDDMVGMLRTAPMPGHPELMDTINTMWMADNDGDPSLETYGRGAATSVAGIRVLRTPGRGRPVTFNWWAPNFNAARDWGPVRRGSKIQFTHSGLGNPSGDRTRYQLMSNSEFDYNQLEAAMNHESDGWLPPYPNTAHAIDMADGFHTHFLFSSGPFDVPHDSSLLFTIALVGGADLHRDPQNNAAYFDPFDPEPFLGRLDFSDFGRNSQWASWVYDSPGVDTDGDGYAGEAFATTDGRVYYRGDGVPDFQGPPPPPPPAISFETSEGRVAVRWNGQRTETEIDPFSLAADFEGYRVYMSRTGHAGDFALLASRDLINFVRFRWDPTTEKWRQRERPFSLDSLRSMYDSLSQHIYGHAFHPDSFNTALVGKALLVVTLDPDDPSLLDSAYYYFRPFDANVRVNDALYDNAVDNGYPVTGVIRKLYPEAMPEDTLLHPDGTAFAPYFEYEYAATGLQVAEPVFLAVTAFDHGDASLDLEPLESSPEANAEEVWPINSAETVKATRPKPGVYPNPYRLSDNYNAQGWENPRGLEPDGERARKVTFYNVPDTCVVSIWSLDGDLVRRIEHRENPASSAASVVVWNLISRNTQAIKTGIYLYSIECRFGVNTGKLVIIK